MSGDTDIVWTRLLAVGAVAAVLLSLVLVTGVSSVAANDATTTVGNDDPANVNDTAPYYDGESSDPGIDSWMEDRESPTLDNVTHYLTRVGGFIVGSGESAQGGAGAAGAMIFGLIVFGAFIGTTVGTNVGPVGGVTIAVIAAAGLTSVGLVPTWMYAVSLFALGLVVLKVLTNVLR